MKAWPAALLALLPLLAGCLGPSEASLVLVASAPRLANGMTIAFAVPRGLFSEPEGGASYYVSLGEQVVYPAGSVLGAPLLLQNGRGAEFVPYQNFVVENGQYTVTVLYEDKRSTAMVDVTKWVHWVYVLPYVRNDTFVADLVLERTSGEPNDRIFAAGQLNLELRYRGEDGQSNDTRYARAYILDGSQSFQRVSVPVEALQQGPRNRGWYSVEATFHNFQANGNNHVPMDPALGSAKPPTNWVYLDVEDECPTPALPPPLGCP